jgi:hypothetical protein
MELAHCHGQWQALELAVFNHWVLLPELEGSLLMARILHFMKILRQWNFFICRDR